MQTVLENKLIKLNNVMSIYINKAKENWIVDRFRKEFYSYTKLETSKSIFQSETVDNGTLDLEKT